MQVVSAALAGSIYAALLVIVLVIVPVIVQVPSGSFSSPAPSAGSTS